jgi:hypothetical protein
LPDRLNAAFVEQVVFSVRESRERLATGASCRDRVMVASDRSLFGMPRVAAHTAMTACHHAIADDHAFDGHVLAYAALGALMVDTQGAAGEKIGHVQMVDGAQSGGRGRSRIPNSIRHAELMRIDRRPSTVGESLSRHEDPADPRRLQPRHERLSVACENKGQRVAVQQPKCVRHARLVEVRGVLQQITRGGGGQPSA